MFTLGTTVLTERLAQPPTPPDPPTSPAPGPTSLADREHLARVLTASGWTDVRISPLDFTCDYSTNGSDGVEERLAGILGTTTGRRARADLEPRLGPAGWATLLDEVRAELRRHLVDGAVRFPAATWLVTARAGALDA